MFFFLVTFYQLEIQNIILNVIGIPDFTLEIEKLMRYHIGQCLTLKNAYTIQTDISLSNLDRDAFEYPEAKIIDSNKNSFPF